MSQGIEDGYLAACESVASTSSMTTRLTKRERVSGEESDRKRVTDAMTGMDQTDDQACENYNVRTASRTFP